MLSMELEKLYSRVVKLRKYEKDIADLEDEVV